MTQPSNSQPPLGDQISEAIRQILKPGGVAVGSSVAFWQLYGKLPVILRRTQSSSGCWVRSAILF